MASHSDAPTQTMDCDGSATFDSIEKDKLMSLEAEEVNVQDKEKGAEEEPLSEEEAAKKAALEAIARKEKTPNEDAILAELDVELAEYQAKNKTRFGALDPDLVASIEEYIEEMKAEAARRPPVKLQEDPRKYQRSAANDPLYAAIPVYDPNEPRHAEMVATIKRHIEESEQKNATK